MRILRFSLSVLIILLIAGCASGPSLKERPTLLPVLDQGKARIFFYRTQIVGGAYQPDVLLNGEKVGNATPRGVFFRDVSPGKYSVTTTMTKEVVNFDIAAGNNVYVKLSYSFGFNIYPELVDSSKGELEASELSFTGQK
jgi:hypothetical protein